MARTRIRIYVRDDLRPRAFYHSTATVQTTHGAEEKKSYDISFKLKAVETAEKKSKEAAALEFGVDPRRLREWCSQKDQIVAMKKNNKSKRRRLDGG